MSERREKYHEYLKSDEWQDLSLIELESIASSLQSKV